VARRLLTAERGSARACAALVLGSSLVLAGCHKHTAPQSESRPVASSSASPAVSFANDARAAHFEAEKKRAEERWSAKPTIEDCSKVLHEDGDAELCQGAASALTAIEQLDASTATDHTLQVLSDGSLALARLSQRARYQSLVDLGQQRTTGDAGVADAGEPTLAEPTQRKHVPSRVKQEHHALELTDSPATRFMAVALRLERDALRNLGAYLEYAPLTVRRSAFETVKKLREQRAQWPLLDHMTHEASLLESDPDLKHALIEFSASGLPRSKRLQPTDSK
jgi:hypothetical protein